MKHQEIKEIIRQYEEGEILLFQLVVNLLRVYNGSEHYQLWCVRVKDVMWSFVSCENENALDTKEDSPLFKPLVIN